MALKIVHIFGSFFWFFICLVPAYLVLFSISFGQEHSQAPLSPIVLELFTSQSCSSCPPADKILEGLAENPDIIALSCPVTYWNHLSWKDTLSQDFCTQRQRNYATAAHRRNVFTPELVINGRDSVVGSQNARVNAAIGANKNLVHHIEIKHEDSHLVAQIPVFDTAISLSLVSYGKSVDQSIASGENSGRVVHYTNPVFSIRTVEGDWGKGGSIMKIEDANIPQGSSGIVLLVTPKEENEHKILAAGRYTR